MSVCMVNSMVSIVLSVVSVSIVVIIDWLNVHLMGVMVLNWVGIIVHFVVLNWMGVIVHFVVSWLCYMRSGVVVMVASGDVWFNVVLHIVLVLFSVSGFVVLAWAGVGMGWLSGGVLMNIHNWVVVRVVGVMRISSWVNVSCLIIVMDGFVVDWLNVVRSIALKIMTDSFMWCGNIVFSHMVVVMVIVIKAMMSMIVVNVLKLNFMVVFTIFVGLMIDFMLGLMINEFMLNRVVLSLTALYNWLNFMNSCLLKRSMV